MGLSLFLLCCAPESFYLDALALLLMFCSGSTYDAGKKSLCQTLADGWCWYEVAGAGIFLFQFSVCVYTFAICCCAPLMMVEAAGSEQSARSRCSMRLKLQVDALLKLNGYRSCDPEEGVPDRLIWFGCKPILLCRLVLVAGLVKHANFEAELFQLSKGTAIQALVGMLT
ncbi:hypothetical protein Nepgr_005253 [Nepenthes gracilis]|uniref:Uncharacterized protein n=1 Tax=Nepenthes gracilis TaxID=150966 RepID=A0AAD3S3B0_NEPGR|nr:hypothetical protein Nepgr_005253 [Nepenthes gracilis]